MLISGSASRGKDLYEKMPEQIKKNKIVNNAFSDFKIFSSI